MEPAPSFMIPDAPSADKLDRLREAATQMANLAREIEDLEASLDRLGKLYQKYATETVPDLMESAGVDRVGLPHGQQDVVLKPYYKAVLPKEPDKRHRAIEWLDAEGHGDLVKDQISVDLGRGQHNVAGLVMDTIKHTLAEAGVDDGLVSRTQDVHHMTLTAFVKEQIEERHVTLPLDLLGATVGRVARVVKRG